MNTFRTITFSGLLLLTSLGCVSTGDYERSMSQTNAALDVLSRQITDIEASIALMRIEIGTLEERLESVASDSESSIASIVEDLEKIERSQAALTGRLETRVTEGESKVEELIKRVGELRLTVVQLQRNLPAEARRSVN